MYQCRYNINKNQIKKTIDKIVNELDENLIQLYKVNVFKYNILSILCYYLIVNR